MTFELEIDGLDRDKLNAYATDHFAELIPDPKAYRTKDELVKALEAAAAGEPVPEPAEKTGGTTVTFTGYTGDGGARRSVVAGTHRFIIETPVEHVDAETVKVLKELPDHTFEFEG